MEVMPLLWSLFAAVAGACAWSGLIIGTGYEIGYLAWGIGALVGFAALRAGGRGTGLAVMCGVFCLLAIVGGKWFAYRHFVSQGIEETISTELTPALYEGLRNTASDFAQVTSEEEHPTFMADHGFYTEAATAADVTHEELANFRVNGVHVLTELAASPPDFETWKNDQVAAISSSYMSSMESNDMFGEMFSGFDALFVFLGVSTAFGMVKRVTDEEGGA